MLETLCCGICGEPHETEFCRMLLSLQIVNDTFTLSKARLTLPEHLYVNDRVDGSTAVIARTTFSVGVRFGPFKAKTSTTLSPNVNFPLKLFNAEAVWDGDNFIYTDVYLETDDEDSCNWMCLVSSAVPPDEQNLFCFQMRKELYFLVVKDIHAGDELKVWYSPQYAKNMTSTSEVISTSYLSPSVDTHDIVPISASVSSQLLDDRVGLIMNNDNASNDQSMLISLNSEIEVADKRTEGHNVKDIERNNRICNKNITKKKRLCRQMKKESVAQPVTLMPSIYVINPLQNSEVLCNDVIPVKNNTTTNSNNNALLSSSNFSPLLLGARQIKSEWKCNQCGNVERNVAAYAKHLMTHYKPSSTNTTSINKQSNICSCNKTFSTKEALDNHKRICKHINAINKVTQDHNSSEINSAVSNNNNVISDKDVYNTNQSEKENQHCEIGNVIDKRSCLNNVEQNNNENDNSDKGITNFVCYNFSASLPDFDDEFGSANSSFVLPLDPPICTLNNNNNNNIDTNLVVNNVTDFNSSESFNQNSNNDIDKLSGQKELISQSSVMSIIDNPMPPILDLTDEDIVFQNSFSKSLTNLNDIVGGSNDNVDTMILPSPNNKNSVTNIIESLPIINNYKQTLLINSDINCDKSNSHSTTLIDQIDLLVSAEEERRKREKETALNNVSSRSNKCMNVHDEYPDKLVRNILLNSSGCNITNNELASGKDKQIESSPARLHNCEENTVNQQQNNAVNVRNEMEVLKEFQCDICKKKFSKSVYLYRHLRKHTGEFMCSICMAVFARKETLVNHTCSVDQNITNLLKKNRKACNLCGQVFKKKSEFNKHQETSHSDALATNVDSTITTMCISCGKTYNTIEALQSHIKVCSSTNDNSDPDNSKKYLCDKCGVTYKNKRGFSLHILKHFDRQFRCPICQKEYHRKDVLEMHIMAHQPVSPEHMCPVCNKKFRRKKSLNTHLETHTSSKRFHCNQCTLSFHQKGNLKKHMKTHKKDAALLSKTKDVILYKCNLCPKTFVKESLLKTHKWIHTKSGNYVCCFCNMTVKYKNSLKRHIEKLHPNEKNMSNKTEMYVAQPTKNDATIIEGESDATTEFTNPDNIPIEPQVVNITMSTTGSSTVDTTSSCSTTECNTVPSLVTIDTAPIDTTPTVMTYILDNDVIIESIPENDMATTGTKELSVNYNSADNAIINTDDKPTTDYFYYILTPTNVTM